MLLTRYHRVAVAALQSAGATVDHSVVGTILALWNAPEQQEGHERRAIQAALALQEAVRAIGSDLEYAVGVHTGEAQVSNIGTTHAPHYTAIGASVHIATSLQRKTSPGSITCSIATLATAGDGLDAVALGPLTIAGQQQGVQAFTVLGIAP